MYYDCDLDVVKTSFSAHSVLKLFADISNEAATIWHKESLSAEIVNSLQDSYSRNDFIVEDNVMICNSVVSGLDRTVHMLYRLNEPQHFKEGQDYKDIKLIFVLLSPKNDGPLHLRRLSRISRLLQNNEFRERILHIDDKDTLRGQFMYPNITEKAA